MEKMKTKHYLLLLLMFISFIGYAQEIYQWRGLQRNGIYEEENLLKSWPEIGPELLWVNENIGDGYGSVAVANDMIFVNGKIDSLSYTFSLDLKGNIIWKTSNGDEFTGTGYPANFPGSRSTPTVT